APTRGVVARASHRGGRCDQTVWDLSISALEWGGGIGVIDVCLETADALLNARLRSIRGGARKNRAAPARCQNQGKYESFHGDVLRGNGNQVGGRNDLWAKLRSYPSRRFEFGRRLRSLRADFRAYTRRG